MEQRVIRLEQQVDELSSMVMQLLPLLEDRDLHDIDEDEVPDEFDRWLIAKAGLPVDRDYMPLDDYVRSIGLDPNELRIRYS